MYDNWEDLEKSILECKKCRLCTNRTNIVFGQGNKKARLMFIGEGPGADEDKQGIPFVGKAGQLMNNAFQALEINREVQTCLNYLRNQVILIKPKIIVLLGSTALKNILGKEYGITAVRGNWMEKNGIKYMPTWHPAALLRDENKKIEFWQDLKEAKKYIDNNIDWEGKN